ncbi:MAG: tetratricopeptide repeat protein [Rhodobacteraceae bacterium]|nr:tetratricopeptide repeat protein [Paracoccaceae bacterium]
MTFATISRRWLPQPPRQIRFAMAAAVVMGAASSGWIGASSAQAESFTGAYLAARHAETVTDVNAAARYFNKALRLRPSDPRLMESALFYSVAAGRASRAVEIAKRVSMKNPADPVTVLTLASDHMVEGDFEGAKERLEGSLESNGAGGLLSKLLHAWSAFGAGETEAALATLSAEEERALYRLFFRYHAGLVASASGDDAAAATFFEEAMTAAGGPTSRIVEALGAAYERTERTEKAEELYDELLALSPSDASMLAAKARLERGEAPAVKFETAVEGAAEAFYGLAAALAQEDSARIALLYVRLGLHLRPDFDEAHLLVGEIMESFDQFDEADSSYAKVTEASPMFNAAQLGRASAMENAEDDDAALELLKGLSSRAPDDPQIHFAIGRFFSRHEQFEDCVVAYKDGIERLRQITDRNWLSHYGLGICLERTKQWQLAEENFRTALELRPNQPDVLNYLGYSLLEKGERLDEAREMIELAVKEKPESGYIVDSLGWALYRLGEFNDAVEHLERAVSLTPVEPVIVDHLGDALWMVGRKMEAEFQWNRALSFEPEEDVVERINRKLKVGLDRVLEEEMAEKDDEGAVEGQTEPKKVEVTPASEQDG